MRTLITSNLSSPRTFSIGERVWDEGERRWAFILSLQLSGRQSALLHDAVPIMLTDGVSSWQQNAGKIYKVAPRRTFRGRPVCYEHAGDIAAGCCGYYCPDLAENCFENELVLNLPS